MAQHGPSLMAARRRFSGRTSRAPRIRASTDWVRIGNAAPTTVAALSKVLLAFVTPNLPNVTVRRTRGRIVVLSDQTATVESQLGAVGFVKVNDLALAAGAASIPGPVTDENDEGWYVWEPIIAVSAFTAGGSAGGQWAAGAAFEFDSKAMRKMPLGYNTAVMVENAHATDPFEIYFRFSQLSSAGYTAA